MFRNIGFGAAALLAAGALAMGCSDEGDTVIAGGAFGIDNFPGSQILDNNVAADGRAFSNQGQNAFNDDITMYWNKANGTAIAVYELESTTGNENLLYASFFNGLFHTPVQIRGENEDADQSVDGFKVLWLNTSGSTDAEALGRNGDAILLFVRQDNDPVFTASGTQPDDDSNDRLYASYFDVSEASAAPTGTVVGGFETNAPAIDDDNAVNFPGGDVDVSAFGFASDSLCCTHEFSSGVDAVDSGETTTFVHFVWRKDPIEGTGTDTGERYNSILFDINQVGNDMPLATATNVIDVPGDDSTVTETASDSFIVHNGHMLWTAADVEDANGNSDQLLLSSVFTTAALPANPVVEGSDEDSDSSDESELPEARNVYGSDHGLASTYFVFLEDGFDGDGSDGNRNRDDDLMLGELRVDASGVTTHPSDSPLEIDAFTGTIDETSNETIPDVGGDVNVRDNGDNGDVDFDSDSTITRINRTGSYIAIAWRQDNTDLTDADDNDEDVGEAFPNVIPFLAVLQTRIDAADARSLTNSISDATPLGALESDEADDNNNLANFGDNAGNDVFDVKFQEGLARGQARSQADDDDVGFDGGPCDRGCVFQGNNLRFAMLFTQFESQDGTNSDGSDDNVFLYLASTTVTLGVGATDAPTIDVTTDDDVEEVDASYIGTDFFAVAVDAGDASTVAGSNPVVSTATAGHVLVFFGSNLSSPEDDTTSSSFDDTRLFVAEETAAGVAGPRTLVSRDASTGFQDDVFQVTGVLGGELVPVNEDTVNSPNHVGTTLHLYWTENENLPGSGQRLATRSYNQADTTATAPTVVLADRFTPALPSSALAPSAPVYIDRITSGPLLDLTFTTQTEEFRTAIDGTTVGVYFNEDEHIYFQQTSSNANGYYTENGLSDPQIVDNDTLNGTRVLGWNLATGPGCNDLPKSVVIFAKDDPSQTNSGPDTAVRIFVRVHN